MTTLTKDELASNLAAKTGVTAQLAHQMVQLTLEEIQGALSQGRKVEFRGFGIFKVSTRKARMGRNPRNPEAGPVEIPAKTVAKFRPGAVLAEAVSKAVVA